MLPDVGSIKKRREKLGKKQYEFAKLAGVGQSMLNKIENGKSKPSYENADKIFSELEELERLEHKGEKTVKDVMHGGVTALDITDTVGKAVELAKSRGFSQFPVLDGQRVVGSVRTADLIDIPKDTKIGWKLDVQFPTVDENTPISQIKEIVKGQQAVLVMRSGELVGIVTAEDLL